ncbi:BnaCnng33560D [Brassica napus]|uniref:BnaCnng33560D protein n=1 Tax=Brassica napus TaxID=3708 RepID=A0A078J462_BRANA|nr:BnaCnng33560D [Brassica napus]
MIHWFKQLRYDQRLASRFYGSFVLFTSLRSTSISLTQSEKWRFYSKTGFSYHHQLLSLSILFPSSHGALNHYTESSQIVYQPENVGSAMADVFIDAMIAEALRAEKASLSDLQSVSGCAVTVGGICGSLLGGYALNNLKMETICLLFTECVQTCALSKRWRSVYLETRNVSFKETDFFSPSVNANPIRNALGRIVFVDYVRHLYLVSKDLLGCDRVTDSVRGPKKGQELGS